MSAFDPATVPSEARDLFAELLREPLRTTGSLRLELEAHLQAIALAKAENEFIDVELANRLGTVSRGLLDEADERDDVDIKRLVQAAVRYFILDDDAEPDLDSVCGLDDDAEVCNAVARYLGRDDLVTAV